MHQNTINLKKTGLIMEVVSEAFPVVFVENRACIVWGEPHAPPHAGTRHWAEDSLPQPQPHAALLLQLQSEAD